VPYTPGDFSDLYHQWSFAQLDRTPAPAVERQLLNIYRYAWEHGDLNDRLGVLLFIYRKEISEAYDIFISGLEDAERLVAYDSVGFIEGLLIKRWRFGPDLRSQLQAYAARFEDGEKDIWPVLLFLDRNEKELAVEGGP